ncbi:MAG: cyclic nucleotide-binding domain-containing protein [Bacteroidota bacterium]
MLNPFRRSYTAEELNLCRFLTKCKLFEDLSNDELIHFLPYMYLREYKPDEVVFFRDDPSQALYVVKSGTIGLSIDVGQKLEYLTTVRTFSSLGDNSLIPNTKRIYNAIVNGSDSCELYVIPQANILDIFERHAEIKAKMNAALSSGYNRFIYDMFKAYKSSLGFFDVRQIYS